MVEVSALKNKTLAITRSSHDAQEFLQLVNGQGGTAIALPAIEIVPKDPQVAEEFIAKLVKKKHNYCAFMSQQAVNVLFDLASDKVAPVLKFTTVIAVGPKTKQSLEEHGIEVRMTLKKFSSAGLVDLLSKMEPVGKKIIIPRSDIANDFATDALSRLGMDVDEISLYTVRTKTIEPIWWEFSNLLLQKRVNAVIFTSASNVSSFFEIMDKVSTDAKFQLCGLTKVVSIGPFTSKALKEKGVECFEAKEHTIKGALEIAKQIL